MNFFFSIHYNDLKSRLAIPRFQNKALPDYNYLLYSAVIKNNKWIINNEDNKNNSKNFFLLDNDNLSNEKIFFLATKEQIEKTETLSLSKLLRLNKYTSTTPDYRANLRVYLDYQGFSSYQSEYPSEMINKKGGILSSVSSLANIKAEKNLLILKNIYEEPIQDQFSIFFVDIKNKIKLSQQIIYTNRTNVIEINKDLIRPETYIITEKYLAVPIYLSIDKGHLSMEHTHPLHEYIADESKYSKVSEFKKVVNEIIR